MQSLMLRTLFSGLKRLLPQQKRCLSLQENLEHFDPTQVGYLEEACVLVNEHDEILGPSSKGDCHWKRTAALHRAFSVFLFTPDNRLILQKRAESKITFPSVWTNTCCSHPLFTPDELADSPDAIGVRRAAQRKLNHELNITGLDVDRFKVMGRFLYKADSDDLWLEHEMDYALVVPDFDLPYSANPGEVENVKAVDRRELDELFAAGVPFSPWFSLFHSYSWLRLWWENLDKLEKLKDLSQIHRLC